MLVIFDLIHYKSWRLLVMTTKLWREKKKKKACEDHLQWGLYDVIVEILLEFGLVPQKMSSHHVPTA